jgi:DNA repair exonuclease SbcCD ATPase subunit
MRFINIQAQNFLSYRNLDFIIQNRGLLLILGANQDESAASSNGSGKTAVIDTFTWALWGETLRGIASDDIVNRRIGKDCFARVAFVDDEGIAYEVVRYRKHRKFQNELHFQTDQGVDLTGSSITDTQKKINSVIGLDFETAIQSLILGQGAMVNFADATDADRKHVLDLILGLQSLEKCLEGARRDKRQYEKDIATDTREIEVLEKQTERVAEEVVQLKERITNYDARRQSKVKELEGKLTEIQVEGDNLANEQENLITTKKAEIGRIDEQVQKLTLQLPKREVIRQSILQKNDEEVKLRGELQTYELQIKAEQERLDYLESTEGASCPLCEKPLSEEEKERLVEQIQATVNDLRKGVTVGNVELQKLRDVRRQLAEREDSFKQTDDQIVKLNLQRQKCQSDIELAHRSDEKRSQMSVRYREIQMQLIQAREERPEYEDILFKKQDELTDLSARIKATVDRNDKNKQMLPYLQFWERGFSNQGLKSFILDNITPILEQASNRFARIMLGDEFRIVISTQSTLKTGEAREKMDIKVLNGLGDDIFDGASAGERQRVNLCIALALQELIASRHKRALGIAFFDEVTTNLDTEGMERFIELLRQELSHKDSIFVISHNPELQMYFDNIVYVTKKNGTSQIEGASDGRNTNDNRVKANV